MIRGLALTAWITVLSVAAPQVVHASRRTELYSGFSDRTEEFERIFAVQRKGEVRQEVRLERPIRFGIVTHHLLASALLERHFETIASMSPPKRIILLGPDHFLNSLTGVSFSDLPWKAPHGRIPGDPKFVTELVARIGKESLDAEALALEHSMGVPIAAMSRTLKDFKIVPIIISRRISHRLLSRLYEALHELIDEDTYVLLSMDFSHYKSSDEADREDRRSRQVILERAFDRVWDLDVDARPALHLLLKLARNHEPVIGDHTNSARISGKLESKSCTSYFNVYFVDSKGGLGSVSNSSKVPAVGSRDDAQAKAEFESSAPRPLAGNR